jgi:hypothetical protein
MDHRSKTYSEELLEVLREDQSNPNSKRTQSGKRCARRSWNHNKRNQPKFGPLNGWYCDPKPIVVNRKALLYGG